MNESEKLIAEMAARFLLATIERGGPTNDTVIAARCVALAKAIVTGATAAGREKLG